MEESCKRRGEERGKDSKKKTKEGKTGIIRTVEEALKNRKYTEVTRRRNTEQGREMWKLC